MQYQFILRIDRHKRIYELNEYNFFSLSLNYFHRDVNAIHPLFFLKDTNSSRDKLIYIQRKIGPLIFLKSFHTRPLP